MKLTSAIPHILSTKNKERNMQSPKRKDDMPDLRDFVAQEEKWQELPQ